MGGIAQSYLVYAQIAFSSMRISSSLSQPFSNAQLREKTFVRQTTELALSYTAGL